MHINKYLMQDHGFVSKINKRLRDTECQWPQPCPKPPNENQCLHCGVLCFSCRSYSENISSNLSQTKLLVDRCPSLYLFTPRDERYTHTWLCIDICTSTKMTTLKLIYNAKLSKLCWRVFIKLDTSSTDAWKRREHRCMTEAKNKVPGI